MNRLDLVDIEKIMNEIIFENAKKIFELNVVDNNFNKQIFIVYNNSVYILKSLRYGYKNKVVFTLIGKNNITKSVYDVDIYQRKTVFNLLGLIEKNDNQVIQCKNQTILY